jgi:hypothetical protein
MIDTEPFEAHSLGWLPAAVGPVIRAFTHLKGGAPGAAQTDATPQVPIRAGAPSRSLRPRAGVP